MIGIIKSRSPGSLCGPQHSTHSFLYQLQRENKKGLKEVKNKEKVN